MLKYFHINILLVILCLCIATSCEKPFRENPTETLTTTEFKFKGHTYYYMRFYGSNRGTIVHAPECKKCFDLYD